MSTHTTIRKVIAAVAVSTAIGLTSLAGGAASADGPKPCRECLYYDITLVNATVANNAAAKGTLTSAPSNANTPMIFQALVTNEQVKDSAPATSDDAPTEEVAFYYNRIAFNYAASK
jgi:hypothetical protein